MEKMKKPIHIVMTPVRNEAWVLRAFLTATSRWADYIIIADQMSTDGSREIYREFQSVFALSSVSSNEHHCQLIVIDNKNPEFNEAERQAMLVAKAREVAAGRDTLLWGLDADEILPANWLNTEDGRRILHSVPGDVFWFKWAQLSPDRKHYGDSVFYPWLFHDDGVEPHGNYVRNMHSMRIPYPIEEKQMYYVNDFRVLHCGLLDSQRISAKNRFYQFVDWEMNHKSPITLARNYAAHRKENQVSEFPQLNDEDWFHFSFNIWDKIITGAKHTWFDDYIYERLGNYNPKEIRKLDIWDESFLSYYGVQDKRTIIDKIVHSYLHRSYLKRSSIVVKWIDKCLKFIFK